MLDEASPRYPEVKSMHQQNLESFVVRARRVREHSLAKDEELLSATGSGTLRYQAAPGGHQSLRFVVPDAPGAIVVLADDPLTIRALPGVLAPGAMSSAGTSPCQE